MENELHILQEEAVTLLKQLIEAPSFSKDEDEVAGILCRYIGGKEIRHTRVGNNVFVINQYYDNNKPTLLLNSHHDTVKPNKGYTLDPFLALEKDGKLFGLGSNDAGGCLVALLATFLHFYKREDLPFNIIFAATAEEEISGPGGIEYTLEYLPKINFAIVGEPTQMHMAVAERGLMVLDCNSFGRAGHAAREEGENALYKAIKDIDWFRSYQFPRVSDLLGPVKMTVTVIETDNKAHNVVPALCRFVVDTRVNECYTFEEVLSIIKENVHSEVKPRSLRMRSTAIALDHPLVKAGLALGRSYYGSPTTSDKALMPFPALKIGPGDSARSHTADEYIYVEEINKGIELYIGLIEQVVL
ncbi:MAG TPA: M20 family metallo-hydrolase [Chitinophagaceae bacterium]|nr:M20 family metallo-hydrolase [Chitinophagaceae bacterium]